MPPLLAPCPVHARRYARWIADDVGMCDRRTGAHAVANSTAVAEDLGQISYVFSDKTGTLTLNALAVTDVRAMPELDAAQVLTLAALASSDGGGDPVDSAIRAAAKGKGSAEAPTLMTFLPFDPATAFGYRRPPG